MKQKPVIISEEKKVSISYTKSNDAGTCEGGSTQYSYVTQYQEIMEAIIKLLKQEPASISFNLKKEVALEGQGQAQPKEKNNFEE